MAIKLETNVHGARKRKTTSRLYKCPECQENVHLVTHAHASKHNMTLDEYVKKHPESFHFTLNPDSMPKKNILSLNNSRKNLKRIEEIKKLREEVEVLRNQKGLTQKEMCKEVHFSLALYSQFKQGYGDKQLLLDCKEYLEKLEDNKCLNCGCNMQKFKIRCKKCYDAYIQKKTKI